MRFEFSAILLTFVISSLSACADDKTITPDFSRYPQTAGFKEVVAWHTEDSEFNAHRAALVVISAFLGGDQTALQYLVTASGNEVDFYDVTNGPVSEHQATRRKQLSQENINGLRLAIKELPTENVFPPIDHLVIVSFRDGATWVTRSYDSRNLPKAMRQIYNIIGERFESKQRE